METYWGDTAVTGHLSKVVRKSKKTPLDLAFGKDRRMATKAPNTVTRRKIHFDCDPKIP